MPGSVLETRVTVMARQVSTQHPRSKLTRSQGVHHSFLSAPTAPGNTTLSTLRPCQPVWKLSVYVSVSSRLSRSQSTWGLRAQHVVGTQSTWAELNWITINNLHYKQYRDKHMQTQEHCTHLLDCHAIQRTQRFITKSILHKCWDSSKICVCRQ